MQNEHPLTVRLLLLTIGLCGIVTQQACNSRVQQVRAIVLADDLTPPELDTMKTVSDTIHAEIVSSWTSFATMEGQYPEDADLLNKEPLKSRMAKLLGPKNHEEFLERFKVTPPLEIEDNVLFDEGYQPGGRQSDAAAIAVDMDDDIIYVGLAVHHKLHIFSEKGDTHYPKQLRTWMTKFKRSQP
ncbi:hypothetical protein [Chitinophaga sp. sic0106]|uniref:hypothetical protein n=1 Tax=Chitinophaga sp. sic0106 TaxID=2854785 RepID=UPI001C44EC84|nr:hypothetical protein [Chitinophaga sp. sic0106]MBV7529282.1 hypothetical protein [Chitinophaga sp. sic0106]